MAGFVPGGRFFGRCVALLAGMVWAACPVAAEPWRQADERALRVGVYSASPLLEWEASQEEPEGILIQTVDAVAARLGLRVEYVSGSYDELQASLVNGTLDLLPAALPEERLRLRSALTAEPVVRTWGTVLVNSDLAGTVNTVVDLAGLTIGYAVDDPNLPALRDLTDFYKIPVDLREFEDEDLLARAVARGAIDGFAADRLFEPPREDPPLIAATGIRYGVHDLYFAFHIDRRDDVMPQFEEELRFLRRSPDSPLALAAALPGERPQRRVEVVSQVLRETAPQLQLWGFNGLEILLALSLLLVLLRLRAAQNAERRMARRLDDSLALEGRLREELLKCRLGTGGEGENQSVDESP